MKIRLVAPREVCSWVIYSDPTDPDSPSHVCGKRATAVFQKANPDARHPDEPKMIRYPRCGTHFTVAGQARAAQDGFETLEMSDDET